MRTLWTRPLTMTAIAVGVLAALLWFVGPVKAQSANQNRLPFLQADRCYRFVFPIAGAPDWKVIEVLEGGWIRAEVGAGPASAKREPVWINTAQIVTVREAECSR